MMSDVVIVMNGLPTVAAAAVAPCADYGEPDSIKVLISLSEIERYFFVATLEQYGVD